MTCPSNLTSCYYVSSTDIQYTAANTACKALGSGTGGLVSYGSAAEQLQVENYFRGQGTLSTYYW